MTSRKTYLIISIIFISALFLRTFPINQGYHFWDETVYLQHAEIIAGDSPNNFNEFDLRPPLFSVILGVSELFTESVTVLHIFVALLSTTPVIASYMLGREFYSEKTGLIAATVFAFSPISILYGHDILPDSFLASLWALTALYVWKWKQTESKNYAAYAGIFTALAVMTKFTSLVLLALPVLLFYKEIKAYLVQKNWLSLIDRFSWFYSAIGLTLLPYFLWSLTALGNPIQTFLTALGSTGSAEPFLVYIIGLPQLFLIPFALPALYYVYSAKKNNKFIFIVAMILVLFLPLQFIISNREVRYLIPIIPLIGVIAGKGVELGVRNLGLKDFDLKIVLILLLLGLPWIIGLNPVISVMNGTMTYNTTDVPVVHASNWIKQNTPEEEIIYTNYDHPSLGYYSKREIVLIGPWELEKGLYSRFEVPGILYYNKDSPYQNPENSTLSESPYFTHMKDFNSTISLYRYHGSNVSK